MATRSCHPAFLFILQAVALVLALARASAINVERDDSAVYRIINIDLKGRFASGTGFLINSTGLVVTNDHVVENARTLLVVHREAAIIKVWPARLLGVSGAKDLALLQAEGITGVPLALNKEGATKGSDVYAVGFPGQADMDGESHAFIKALLASHFHDVPLSDQYDNFVRSSVKKGNVEDVRMRLWGNPEPQGKIQVVQHSATFTGGNSGGPLLDNEDQVVGVNTIVEGEGAIKDANGEKILLGNLLRFSSSSTELIAYLDALHLSYLTQALHPTSTPTPTPTPTLAPTATPMPSIALAAAPLVRESPRESLATDGDNPPASNRLLWIAGILLLAAAVAGGIVLFVMLRGGSRPTEPDDAIRRPPPFSPHPPPRPLQSFRPTQPVQPPQPPPAPRPREPDTRWLLSGQDAEGRPYRLAFDTGTFAGRQGALRLGRSASQTDLRIDHASLSRIHAELRCRNHHLFIVDKDSANGTKVNGRVLLSESDEARISPGDMLHLGEVTLVLGLDRPE